MTVEEVMRKLIDERAFSQKHAEFHQTQAFANPSNPDQIQLRVCRLYEGEIIGIDKALGLLEEIK